MVTNSHGARGAIPSFCSLFKSGLESATDGGRTFIFAIKRAVTALSVPSFCSLCKSGFKSTTDGVRTLIIPRFLNERSKVRDLCVIFCGKRRFSCREAPTGAHKVMEVLIKSGMQIAQTDFS